MTGSELKRQISHLGRICPVCNSDAWLLLPVPAAGRSMLSDGAVITESLQKCTCSSCGLAQHVVEQQGNYVRDYFGPSYLLGDHQPNIGSEGGRQKQYAEWILNALGKFRPSSILELGCGNGALLQELMTALPAEKAVGLEPSERGVRWAQRCGLPVHQVYISGAESVTGFNADLVFSVNVIEHTPKPASFLLALRAAVNEEGLVLLICPDGSAAGSELLFFDHFFSFCPSNILSLLQDSALKPVGHHRSPASLSGFQMIVAEAHSGTRAALPSRTDLSAADVHALHSRRVSYLLKWKHLDKRLCDAMNRFQRVAVFGTGEMAQLVRAYAPVAWDLIDYFVIDDPTEREFCGRPVVPCSDWRPSQDELVLLAVSRPALETVAARLRLAGHTVMAVDEP